MPLPKQIALLLTLSVLSTVAHAEQNGSAAALETSDVDYGELYVVQKKEVSRHRWVTGVGYSYGFSNPYSGQHGVMLSLDRRIGEFFAVGLTPIYYMNTQKDVARVLSAELSSQRIKSMVYTPKYGAYAVGKFAPLSGLLNLLNQSTVNFELMLELGAGTMWYEQETGALPSLRAAIMPHVMFSNRIGLSFGLISYFDRFRDASWQNRLDTAVNFVAGF